MAIVKDDQRESPAAVSDVLGHARLVQAVLLRLDARARLDALAREIYEGLTPQKIPKSGSQHEPGSTMLEWMSGEADASTFCSNKGTDPNTIFQCGKSVFNCDKFVCQSDSVFNGCGKSPATDYGCKQVAAGYVCEDKFECNANIFDCGRFDCSTPDGTGSFVCDEAFDFGCNWSAFNCLDDFDCTAGHIFLCGTNHACTDSFDCRPTGDPACQTASEYDRNGDGQVDTAGDFACGTAGGSQDAFWCDDKFQCGAADEFECTSLSQFYCGDGGGTDSFDCGSSTKFNCTTGGQFFQCNPMNNFTCSNKTTPYSDPVS